ncbi:4Fe-4S binding protein [Desulfosarcina cetonica]
MPCRGGRGLCKGCGNCISICPSDAADSPYRDHVYLEMSVEKMLTDS